MLKPATYRLAAEILEHEGAVLEAYKDSVGVWTWGVGVTNYSPHKVYPRYKDNPQPLSAVLTIFLWTLDRYLEDVDEAFAGHELTEAQRAGAGSFHWNTGDIKTASWVKKWKAGDVAGARKAIMNYRTPASIIDRRKKERALFFDGKWSQTGRVPVYQVSKPSYRPARPVSRKYNEDLDAALEAHYSRQDPEKEPAPDPTPKPKGNNVMSFLIKLLPFLPTFLRAIFPGSSDDKDKPTNSIVQLFRTILGFFGVDMAGDELGLFGLIGKLIPGLQGLTPGGEGLGDLLTGGNNVWFVIILFVIQMVIGNMTKEEENTTPDSPDPDEPGDLVGEHPR